MNKSFRFTFWLALLAQVVFNIQLHVAHADEATLPGDKGPGTMVTPGGTNKTQAIPWDQIGAKAGADYHGDGLTVTATATGAHLHCVFQRLDGEATSEGLWLTSTVTNGLSDPSSVTELRKADRFRVVAREVGRTETSNIQHRTSNIQLPKSAAPALQASSLSHQLSDSGDVTVDGQTVRFTRAGVVEEYSVSMDGVRQDFVILERPSASGRMWESNIQHPVREYTPSTQGAPGELRLELSVSGARVEATAVGAELVLEKSGRKLAYGRLRATDANGKELPARIEVARKAAPTSELGLLAELYKL